MIQYADDALAASRGVASVVVIRFFTRWVTGCLSVCVSTKDIFVEDIFAKQRLSPTYFILPLFVWTGGVQNESAQDIIVPILTRNQYKMGVVTATQRFRDSSPKSKSKDPIPFTMRSSDNRAIMYIDFFDFVLDVISPNGNLRWKHEREARLLILPYPKPKYHIFQSEDK